VARQIVAFADFLTRLATVRPSLRGLRNVLLRTLSRLSLFRRRLAWRLSGLIYRGPEQLPARLRASGAF